MRREDVLELLARNKEGFRSYGVKSLALFGSMARGEAGPDSDIDLLVEFGVPTGLFGFLRLKAHLEKLLGRPVDLVTPDALREEMRAQILEEAIRAA